VIHRQIVIAKSAQQNALRIFQCFFKIHLKTPLQLHVVPLFTPQIFAYHPHFVSCNFSLLPSMPKEKGVITIIMTSSLLDAPKPSPPKRSMHQILHNPQFANLAIHKTEDYQSPTIDYKKIANPHC